VLSVLEVRLYGEVTIRTEFCVGDDVTLVCAIGNIGTYAWTVPGLVESNDGVAVVGLAASTQMRNGQKFTLEATRIDPTTTISTLRFTVSDLLNERNITCEEAGATTITNFQVISVLGK